MVVPFNPADFCFQIQSTQKKYSLDPINRSREMCHGLVSKCISFIRKNYIYKLCNSHKPYFKTEVTEGEYSIGKTCKPENSHMPVLSH